MLDNRYAILFIRGEYPVIDLKYDLMKHPKIAFTADGGAEPFIHGRDTKSEATIRLIGNEPELRDRAVNIESLVEKYSECEILTNEDLDEIYKKEN